MLKVGLENFPSKTATKNELLKKVEEIFFKNNKLYADDQTWRKSALQVLATGQRFKRTKGVYILCGNMNKYHEINPRDLQRASSLTMKEKLSYVLNGMPDKRGNIKEITEAYIKIFEPDGATEDAERKKLIKNSLHKTLLACPEFDKSLSKTIYSLNS